MIEILAARFPEDRGAVQTIFREYVTSPSTSLDYQDYEAEFATLPGNYVPPSGCLLLAWEGNRVAGCAALRPVDDEVAEMKRVYVRPEHRGQGIGRRLVEQLLRLARQAGYRRICLDVLAEFTAAQALYRTLGFLPAPPVSFNPTPGALFLGLDLPPPP